MYRIAGVPPASCLRTGRLCTYGRDGSNCKHILILFCACSVYFWHKNGSFIAPDIGNQGQQGESRIVRMDSQILRLTLSRPVMRICSLLRLQRQRGHQAVPGGCEDALCPFLASQ
jgi:hypothetical protein